MKKLQLSIASIIIAAAVFSCKTSQMNSTATDIKVVDPATASYAFADTVMKYSMTSYKAETKLNVEMNMLGKEIAGNLGTWATVFQMGQAVVVSFDKGDVFDVGQAVLNENTEATLRSLAFNLNQNPNNYIVVFGRTDNTGSQATNDKLGYRRASTVANYLHQLNIEKERLFVDSYGEKYADYVNKDFKNRAKNRRVDILIIPSNEMRLGAN